MLILAFVTLFVVLIKGCTYTPVEWLQHKNLIENQTLCNVTWLQLLEVNVAQMTIKDNQLWVVVSQEYIGANLNSRRAPSFSHANHSTHDNIPESILLIGNTLEKVCDNVSQWVLGEREDFLLGILHQFNRGLFPEWPSCDLVSIAKGSQGETFFHYQPVDTFIVRDYTDNETISRSEYIGTLNTNVILCLSLGFTFLWLFICFLKMVIDGNARKRYRLWKNQTSPTQPTVVVVSEEEKVKNPLMVNLISSDDDGAL